MKGVPVLIYHALEDDAHPAGLNEPGAQLYTVNTSTFRDQMRYLREQGFRVQLLDEVLECGLQEKVVVLTFDDGHRSSITLAVPILREFGFRAEFFITTGWIGRPNYLTSEEICRLVADGMGVGSHGVSHAFLDDLPETEALGELVESRAILTRLIRRPVQWFSAPGGRLRPRLEVLAAQAGFRGVCTSSPGLFRPNRMCMQVPRQAIRRSTSMAGFAPLVHQRSLTRAWSAMRYKALVGVKHLVGNSRYVRLHKWVSKLTHTHKGGAS